MNVPGVIVTAEIRACITFNVHPGSRLGRFYLRTRAGSAAEAYLRGRPRGVA